MQKWLDSILVNFAFKSISDIFKFSLWSDKVLDHQFKNLEEKKFRMCMSMSVQIWLYSINDFIPRSKVIFARILYSKMTLLQKRFFSQNVWLSMYKVFTLWFKNKEMMCSIDSPRFEVTSYKSCWKFSWFE